MSPGVFSFQNKCDDWVLRTFSRRSWLEPNIALSGSSRLVMSLHIYLYFELSRLYPHEFINGVTRSSELPRKYFHYNLLNIVAVLVHWQKVIHVSCAPVIPFWTPANSLDRNVNLVSKSLNIHYDILCCNTSKTEIQCTQYQCAIALSFSLEIYETRL